jgi:hypothetical protein
MQAGIELAKRAVEPIRDRWHEGIVRSRPFLKKPYTVDQLLTSFSVNVQMGPQPSRSRLATYELSRLRAN